MNRYTQLLKPLARLLVLGLALKASAGLAEGLKKGTSACTDPTSCSFYDVPLGTPGTQRALPGDLKPIPPMNSIADSIKTTHSAPKRRGNDKQKNMAPGNLPAFYYTVDRASIQTSDKVVYVPSRTTEILKGLRSGDILLSIVEQSVKASPNVPTPIRAFIVRGPFKGGIVLGRASLDKDLKRVLFDFDRLRLPNQDAVYTLKATGLSPSGQVGLEGDYHSESGRFFVGELVAATAAGYADATIARQQNALGNFVQEPSVSNAAKSGLVTALSKSADRFAEGARSAPEWVEIPGYQELQIIVQEDPISNGG